MPAPGHLIGVVTGRMLWTPGLPPRILLHLYRISEFEYDTLFIGEYDTMVNKIVLPNRIPSTPWASALTFQRPNV